MTLREIADACCGKLITDGTADENSVITDISIDSRKIKKDFLYIPIKGERFDGHDFIGSAAGNGALCTLTEKESDTSGISRIIVKSTFQALKDIAEYYRSLFKNIKIIGISGSSGKTSTKEMIFSVLSENFNVMKTEGNLNNEIGVPQTIFRLNDEYDAAVIEMGINHFGEMTNLAKMVRPDIGVITNIGCAHLEFLGSRDGILKAKTEMLPFISSDGMTVLNGDDDKLRTVNHNNTVFFGLDKMNDVRAENITPHGADGTEFTIVSGNTEHKAYVPALGNHMVMNALAAYVIAQSMSMPEDKIISGISHFKNIDGRFNVIKTPEYTLINDCYNANPESVKASLKVLSTLEGRRVAILADMRELGENSETMHYETGKLASELIDIVICIGDDAKFIEKGAMESSTPILTAHFDTNEQAISELKNILKKSDIILIKGSHSMKLNEITDFLKN